MGVKPLKDGEVLIFEAQCRRYSGALSSLYTESMTKVQQTGLQKKRRDGPLLIAKVR